jgi:Rhodopirellula transposase DDE domain
MDWLSDRQQEIEQRIAAKHLSEGSLILYDVTSTYVDNYRVRGRHKSEILLPNLEADIRSLVDPESQADPKFQSTFLYARITALAVRSALVSQKNYDSEQLPSRQTIGAILNRMGYRLKKHKKPSP